MQKKRIEYIDLAKGICMLLVVMGHIQEAFADETLKDVSYVMSYFRMPLYFMLSGLFFKTYSGLHYFLIKKLNHLLIPYLFFLLLGFVTFRNYPIWFLFSLFSTNIIFYFCNVASERLGKKFLLPLMCLAISVVGFYLPNGRGCDNLWMEHLYYVETAMTCIGFYYVGFFIRNSTEFLTRPEKSSSVIYAILLLLLCGAVVFVVGWYYDYADTGFRLNFFDFPLYALYLAGLAGSVGVMIFARIVGHLPYVSYIGRYSIIVLLTHFPMTVVLARFLPDKMPLTAVLVLLLEIPVIFVCKRYFPYLFAQKELIPLPEVGKTKL